MYSLVSYIALLLVSFPYVFHAGQEISTSTVRGFIGLNTLRREAVLLYDSIEEEPQQQQQRILPSMNFSCSGNISKWTFVARSRTGDQYPLFQLWRPNGTGIYRRVYESSITSTLSGQSDVEEYIPNDPVPFEAGYIFGVYQPQQSRRRLSVVHVDVDPSEDGYKNYHRNNMMSLEEFNTGSATAANNYPLVAVDTSEYQKTLSDKQRCQPLSRHFC